MNLTSSQIIALLISTFSVLGGASAQLTELFGKSMAADITSACALLTAILGGWIAVLTGQGAVVRQVQSMPGVSKIVVNSQANDALAAVAADPANVKVEKE